MKNLNVVALATIVAATVLAALHVIAPEAVIGLIAGVAVPSHTPSNDSSEPSAE